VSFSTSILAGARAALAADTALVALLKPAITPRVYPIAAPPDEPTPYIVLTQTEAAFDTSDSFGREHTVDVHAFSEDESPLEALQIAERIEAALQDASLTLSKGALVLIRLTASRCDADPDGGFHAVVTFRALISE
jgi:hypothetical protein